MRAEAIDAFSGLRLRQKLAYTRTYGATIKMRPCIAYPRIWRDYFKFGRTYGANIILLNRIFKFEFTGGVIR